MEETYMYHGNNAVIVEEIDVDQYTYITAPVLISSFPGAVG